MLFFLIIIIIIITLFNEGEDIDYWSPSSFHNGPPNQIKSNQMLVFGERGKPEHPGENLS